MGFEQYLDPKAPELRQLHTPRPPCSHLEAARPVARSHQHSIGPHATPRLGQRAPLRPRGPSVFLKFSPLGRAPGTHDGAAKGAFFPGSVQKGSDILTELLGLETRLGSKGIKALVSVKRRGLQPRRNLDSLSDREQDLREGPWPTLALGGAHGDVVRALCRRQCPAPSPLTPGEGRDGSPAP